MSEPMNETPPPARGRYWHDLSKLRTDLADVKRDLKNLRIEIKDLRTELKADLKEMRDDIRWTAGFIIVVVGLMIKFLK